MGRSLRSNNIALLSILLSVLFLGGCGDSGSNQYPQAAKVAKVDEGLLSGVIDLNQGNRARWNSWTDNGGLNMNRGNVLHGINIEGISASYFKGDAGSSPANVEMTTYASPAEMRRVLSIVCGINESDFVRIEGGPPKGEAKFTRDGIERICYYEGSTSGGPSHMIILSKLVQ